MKDIDIYQWDSGLTIESALPILFSARGDRDGLVVASKDGHVPIPNQLTAKGRDISAYQIDGARVVDSCHISVTAIAKPSNYIYTETEIDSIESFKDFAVKAIQDAQKQYQGVADGAEKALKEIKEQVKLIEQDEQSRKQAETARVESETARATAEKQRDNTFDSWTAEEAKRTQQETARVSAEQARETSEAQRETDTKTAIANLDSAITKANGKVDTAVSDANAKVDALVDSTKTKTDAQIALAKEATDKANASASKADTATASAIEATAKANEVASTLSANVLKGNVKGTFIHVDDVWPSSLLSIEIEGAAEQVTTTGKNLLNPEPLKDISNFDTSQKGQGFYVYKFDVPSTGDYTVSVKQSVKDTNYLMISNSPTFGSGQQVWISHPSIALKTSATFNGVSAVYLYFSDDIAKVQDVLVKVGGVQIEKGTTPTAYEPYTGGKSSPSPDYPQEIKVIENPVLKVTGRNLIDVHEGMPESDCDKVFPSETKRIIKPGEYVVGLTRNNFCNKNAIVEFTIGDGSITLNSNIGGYGIGIGVQLIPGESYSASATLTNGGELWFSFYKADGTHVSFVKATNAVVPDDIAYAVLIINVMAYNTPCIFTGISVSHAAGTVPAYKPYQSTSTAITLPAEHPYLAKLTDGTADTIEVDKDGNVSLVARVGIDRDVREIESFMQGQYYNLKTTVKAFASLNTSYSGGEMCSAIPSRNTSPNREGIYRTWTGVYVKDTSGRTREEIQAEIDKNAPLTIAVKIPETVYPLGKVTVPSLPDSISNVWTEAEVQGKTAIEYTKDVNIAYDKLANAIVASVGGA